MADQNMVGGASVQAGASLAGGQDVASPVDVMLALVDRADQLLRRLDRWMPAESSVPDFSQVIAARWRKRGQAQGRLEAVKQVAGIRLADLQHLDRQKTEVGRNTAQFVRGLPANDVLLTGARGTGKSSLVKAMLNEYSAQGLRLIEVDRLDLVDLPEIVDQVAGLAQRFIVFCDDLSFESGDPGYKALKVVLDGSVAARSDNVLVYATSNRRHLLPEYMHENTETRYDPSGEIHPGESVEEKVSLSERFGLWVPFHPFRQDDYLAIVQHWLRKLGCNDEQIAASRQPSLQWALARGSRSGRVAAQFAADWAGQQRAV